jgi:hypothetical protein
MAVVKPYAEAGQLSERQAEFLNKLLPVYEEYEDVSGEFEIIYRFIEDIARLEDDQQVKVFPRQTGACASLMQVSQKYKGDNLSTQCVWVYNPVTHAWVCK